VRGPKKALIKIKLKDEMKVELGRSPDDGDAVIMANIDTLKDEAAEALIAAHTRKAYDPYADLRR
jgi:hypothetical protein